MKHIHSPFAQACLQVPGASQAAYEAPGNMSALTVLAPTGEAAKDSVDVAEA
jgi:hypothetical protein